MASKHNIFFDFDETIFKSVLAFVETYKEKHRLEIDTHFLGYPIWEHIHTWNMNCQLPMLSVDELEDIFDSPRLFDHLAFYADPIGITMKHVLLSACNNPDINVYIASKGNPKNLELKREFIQMKLPFFPIENFIPMEGTVMDKSSLSGLVLFDDHEDNLYSANVKHRVLVNFSGTCKEWNTKAMYDDNIIKCFTVSEVLETLKEMLRHE